MLISENEYRQRLEAEYQTRRQSYAYLFDVWMTQEKKNDEES